MKNMNKEDEIIGAKAPIIRTAAQTAVLVSLLTVGSKILGFIREMIMASYFGTSFVVDAYTVRIGNRHGLVPPDVDYAELRDFFMDVLPKDVALYNEYHALLVRVGNGFCKKSKPQCEACPLYTFLSYGVPCDD